MNNDTDNEQRVSEAYRSYSTETVPADLDRAVLRKAGAIHARGFWARFYSWRRPLAFAATLVLGVTLVYDMQTALQQSGTPYLPSAEIVEDSYQRADQEAATRIAPATTQDAASPVESATREPAAPATNGAARKLSAPPAAVDAMEQKAMSLQEQNFADGETREKQLAKPQVDKRAAQQTEATTRNAAASLSSTAEDACDDARFESAKRWWRCVQQRRAAGETTQAEAEWRNLKRQFPDFPIPSPPD